MKGEKECENCRHYLRHYIKRDTDYHGISCGHCANINNKNKSSCKPSRICGLWESAEIKEAERKKSMQTVLRTMAERVNSIAEILKDDLDCEKS